MRPAVYKTEVIIINKLCLLALLIKVYVLFNAVIFVHCRQQNAGDIT